MKRLNKVFYQKVFASIIAFLLLGLLAISVLANRSEITFLSFCLLIPYLAAFIFTRFNTIFYLVCTNYTIAITFICQLGGISYTLLPKQNALYYYGLSSPWNYVTWLFIVPPFVSLFLYLLFKGNQPIEVLANTYIKERQKINLDTKEYYLNQKVNVFKDILKSQMSDWKLEKFLERHVAIAYKVIAVLWSIAPVIPIIISRSAGEQPRDYYFLLCTSYLALIYAIAFAIGIHMARTVLYIQKKHNIKLKLAYKDDKDIIIV